MKIGIMSMQRIRNYGSFLQAYGLKRIIESLGHEVVFVDFKIEAPANELGTLRASIFYRAYRKAVRKIRIGKNKILRSLRSQKREGFASFIQEFESKYLRELGVPKEKQYRTKVDVLVIGSDEVFNCTQGRNVGFSRELFGADNRAGKVISYAASFGNTTLEKLEKNQIQEEVKKLLGNFSALSVRDRNSYDIVKALTSRKPEIHLDPALIYDFKMDMQDVVTETDYIVVYAYNRRMTEEEGKAVRDFARSKNKKLIAVSGEQDFCDQYVYSEPLQMLSYFKHADYVITDTFHGTIFSVVNHKKFAVLIRKDENAEGYGNQEKLGYLLEQLGLASRRVEQLCELPYILQQEIDYRQIEHLLEKERVRTLAYLKNELSE